jgi:hypothetical protein
MTWREKLAAVHLFDEVTYLRNGVRCRSKVYGFRTMTNKKGEATGLWCCWTLMQKYR